MTRQYDPESDTELSLVIARSVAEAADLDPSELAEPMYGAVDPDAVEQVFFGFATPKATTGRVMFEYGDHTVIVRSDGTVAVYD